MTQGCCRRWSRTPRIHAATAAAQSSVGPGADVEVGQHQFDHRVFEVAAVGDVAVERHGGDAEPVADAGHRERRQALVVEEVAGGGDDVGPVDADPGAGSRPRSRIGGTSRGSGVARGAHRR